MENWKIFKLEVENKIEYQVSLYPKSNPSFIAQLDSLLDIYGLLLKHLDLKEEELVFCKVFVTDCLNQKKIMKEHPLFQNEFKNSGFSIIEQPPLDGNKINMLLWFVKGIEINKYRINNAFYLETDKYLHIFHCIRCNSDAYSNIENQTEQAFIQHKYLIQKYGMNILDNCIRTWLYVRDIDKDYSGVVKGRNDFFTTNGLNVNTHFIASTGIGGSGELANLNICIDLYSIKGLRPEQIKQLKALNYLNPTHEYGVSFERGTCITYAKEKHIFISGTASIDKNGNCVYKGDIMKQLERIFLNIENLLHDADADLNDICHMIIYLRDISDYNIVHSYVNHHYSAIPSVIVLAKVCRPEWLVEIECQALKKI